MTASSILPSLTVGSNYNDLSKNMSYGSFNRFLSSSINSSN
jgi:hypothetical protein